MKIKYDDGEMMQQAMRKRHVVHRKKLTDIPNEGWRSNPSPPPIGPAFAGGG
jgi:hypothetical protein